LGQASDPPPKQRAIPFMSRLQTAFLPSQQFCEAGSPAAPQMFPGGLQAVPPPQRKSLVLLVSAGSVVESVSQKMS
jgi:hypothetical protein